MKKIFLLSVIAVALEASVAFAQEFWQSSSFMIGGGSIIGGILIAVIIMVIIRKKRSSASGLHHTAEDAERELDKVLRFERELGTLLFGKQQAYRQSMDLFSRLIAAPAREDKLERSIQERYDQLVAVEKSTRPASEDDFWLFSDDIDASKRKGWLESWPDKVAHAVGNATAPELQRTIDDVQKMAELLEKWGKKPNKTTLREAVEFTFEHGASKDAYDTLLAAIQKVRDVIPRQKSEMKEFFSLEHHELALLRRYYKELVLEENNLNALKEGLAKKEVKDVMIADKQLEAMIKRLVVTFKEIEKIFSEYDNHLENEAHVVARAQSMVKEYRQKQEAKQAVAAQRLSKEAQSLLKELDTILHKEADFYYSLVGKFMLPDQRRLSDVPENGWIGQSVSLVSQIQEKEKRAEEERQLVASTESRTAKKARKKAAVYGVDEEIGVFVIRSLHRAVASRLMGDSAENYKKIYLINNCTISAHPDNDRRGFIYVKTPSLIKDVKIEVDKNATPFHYLWAGKRIYAGDTKEFGNLKLEFQIERHPKSVIKTLVWGKVDVTPSSGSS